MEISYACKDIADGLLEHCKGIIRGEKSMHLHIFTNASYAGQQYLRNKVAVVLSCGIHVHVHYAGYQPATQDVQLFDPNWDPTISNLEICMCGISTKAPTIIQLPYHPSVDNRVDELIEPQCDVDGLVSGSVVAPATAQGIYYFLERNQLTAGKRIVIIGRSQLVGKPLTKLLLETDATVTLCHSKTVNLVDICKSADVIVSAVGKAGFITREMVNHKKDVVIVDVGINRGEDGKLRGDVAKDVAGEHTYVTPVPGGVGLLTTACLVENIIKLYNKHRNFYESDKG